MKSLGFTTLNLPPNHMNELVLGVASVETSGVLGRRRLMEWKARYITITFTTITFISIWPLLLFTVVCFYL